MRRKKFHGTSFPEIDGHAFRKDFCFKCLAKIVGLVSRMTAIFARTLDAVVLSKNLRPRFLPCSSLADRNGNWFGKSSGFIMDNCALSLPLNFVVLKKPSTGVILDFQTKKVSKR